MSWWFWETDLKLKYFNLLQSLLKFTVHHYCLRIPDYLFLKRAARHWNLSIILVKSTDGKARVVILDLFFCAPKCDVVTYGISQIYRRTKIAGQKNLTCEQRLNDPILIASSSAVVPSGVAVEHALAVVLTEFMAVVVRHLLLESFFSK